MTVGVTHNLAVLTMGESEPEDVKKTGHSEDSHLEWLDQAKARKVFNLGAYSLDVSREQVVVKGKIGREWGEKQYFERDSVEASAEIKSRSSVNILYVGLGFYILGYLTLFVVDGIPSTDQTYILVQALGILLLPMILYVLLPLKLFVLGTVIFYLLLFSLPEAGYRLTIFKVAEDMLPTGSPGESYVEAFFVAVSLMPILIHKMVSQTLVRYDFWLKEGKRTFHTVVSGRVAPVAVNYIRNWTPPRGRFSIGKFMWSDFHLFFLRLSKARMKSCFYCGERTLVECNRCHLPVCTDHFEVFRGYKVCLDCYVERKGSAREFRRRVNR
jgi:hypothetical protein